jgi:hypothetical protein
MPTSSSSPSAAAPRGRAKATKDRAQAAALIEALAEHRPSELAAAYAEARAEGPQWEKALDQALARDARLRERLAG